MIVFVQFARRMYQEVAIKNRGINVKCIDTKYRLFRNYKDGLVSFEDFRDYIRYKNFVTTL